MNLTAAEAAALDDFQTTVHNPPVPGIADSLTELGISPDGYIKALNAEGDFVDYIAAVALQDLHRAGVLTRGPEVVAVAKQFWPLTSDNA